MGYREYIIRQPDQEPINVKNIFDKEDYSTENQARLDRFVIGVYASVFMDIFKTLYEKEPLIYRVKPTSSHPLELQTKSGMVMDYGNLKSGIDYNWIMDRYGFTEDSHGAIKALFEAAERISGQKEINQDNYHQVGEAVLGEAWRLQLWNPDGYPYGTTIEVIADDGDDYTVEVPLFPRIEPGAMDDHADMDWLGSLLDPILEDIQEIRTQAPLQATYLLIESLNEREAGYFLNFEKHTQDNGLIVVKNITSNVNHGFESDQDFIDLNKLLNHTMWECLKQKYASNMDEFIEALDYVVGDEWISRRNSHVLTQIAMKNLA